MKRQFLAAVIILGIFLPCLVFSSEGILPTPDYSGNLKNRSTLTGDWNGTRSNLADNGLHLDFDITNVYQNLFSGGINEKDAFVSSQHFLMQFDTGKAGLWPGGLLRFRAESRLGKSVNGSTGGIAPVNHDAVFPVDTNNLNSKTIAVTELSYAQFLSPEFGIFGGLLNTREGDSNELAGNLRSNSKFMNFALLASMTSLRTVSSVTLGGGFIFIPKDWIRGRITFFDTEESSAQNPFTSGKGNTIATEWKLKHAIKNLPGAQNYGFTYGFDNSFATLDYDPRDTIPGLVAGEGIPRTNDSWEFYHSMHQYLQWKDGRGWGVFTRFGIAEESSNPIHMSVAAGISGNAMLKTRPKDTFGLGYYYLKLSDSAILGFLDIDDEQGVELWYNAEITPWLHITADIQVVDTALGTPGRGTIPPGFISLSLPESETAWIFGLRSKIQF